MTRIYPDTLDRLEIQSGQSDDHWQIYSITDGMGGSGIGDIAGRLVQEDLIKQVADLGHIDPLTFDFAKFAYDFISSVKLKLKERLARYANQDVGCSLAFLLINGSTAYTLSIGTNRLYLIRDNKIHRMSKEHRSSENGFSGPTMFLGNSLIGQEAKPDNLNKLNMQTDDIILLLSDGVHDTFSDQEILELSQSNSSFVKVIDIFNKELATADVADDCTVLGLKVLDARSIGISEQLLSDSPTEPINLSSLSQQESKDPERLRFDSDQFDDYEVIDDGTHLEDLEDDQSGKTNLVQGLLLFLKSYLIGLLIGIVLIFLFWLIYFKLR